MVGAFDVERITDFDFSGENQFKQKTAYEIMPSLVGSEMCIRDRFQWRGCIYLNLIIFLEICVFEAFDIPIAFPYQFSN